VESIYGRLPFLINRAKIAFMTIFADNGCNFHFDQLLQSVMHQLMVQPSEVLSSRSGISAEELKFVVD